MDPVAALHEIAFWLERELAVSFKVQAFRRAAAALEGFAADEIAEKARNGELRRIKGIGGRSFEVVRQAVDGSVPDYLADLRERNSAPLAQGGAELRAQLRGDLHSHSDWSDGTTPIPVMAATAKMLGHEYLALTDHSPNLTIANGLKADRLRKQLDVVAEVND